MAGLSQINLSFDPLEDRLLLRVSSSAPGETAEYRMWLTRRFVRIFWSALMKTLDSEADPRVDPGGRTALREFEEEAALSSADFSTPYRQGAPSTPLGPEPVLASRLQIRKVAGGRKVLSLLDQGNRGITVTLTTQMIHSIRKLLVDAAQKAQWDLPLSLYSRTTPAAARVPHTIQ